MVFQKTIGSTLALFFCFIVQTASVEPNQVYSLHYLAVVSLQEGFYGSTGQMVVLDIYLIN